MTLNSFREAWERDQNNWITLKLCLASTAAQGHTNGCVMSESQKGSQQTLTQDAQGLHTLHWASAFTCFEGKRLMLKVHCFKSRGWCTLWQGSLNSPPPHLHLALTGWQHCLGQEVPVSCRMRFVGWLNICQHSIEVNMWANHCCQGERIVLQLLYSRIAAEVVLARIIIISHSITSQSLIQGSVCA